MSETLGRYQEGHSSLPDRMLAWPLTGAGWDNLGEDDAPVFLPVPQPGPDELLARPDAVGLCFSDIKILRSGGEHPRLRGRDLQQEPVIMGHEVALTIVGVGAALQGQYHVGQRFVVQPDVYYQGVGLAYGYVLPGGMAQYGILGKEILQGDEGCYLLPLADEDGYAETALSEPWACIEASCHLHYRGGPAAGGDLWVVGNGGSLSEEGWRWLAQARPASVTLSDLPAEQVALARSAFAEGTTPIRQHSGAAGQTFDDIVILGVQRPEAIEQAQQAAKFETVICILADAPLARPVSVDVGRIHYDRHLFVGARGNHPAAAYGAPRSELQAGGRALFIGASGAMGQMWVQRAVQMSDSPRHVLAVDMKLPRFVAMEAQQAPLAAANQVDFATLYRDEYSAADAYRAAAQARMGGPGDDIVILAPVPVAVAEALPLLATNGVMNLFAGIARGTMASLDLSGVWLQGQRLIGSSGSSLADIRYTLGKVQRGELQTRRSVAAVGGIETAKAGWQAVADGRFPGKVVIYPQIRGLPLTELHNLQHVAPAAYAQLEDGRVWTRAAERALLETFVK